MKKIISLFFVLTFVFSTVNLVSCGRNNDDGESEENSYKFGIGVHAEVDKKSANGSSDGSLEAVYTVAATVIDSEGKIVKCTIDAIESSVDFSSQGKIKELGDFKSKRELGDSYIMSSDEKKLKWYEQADEFARLCVGKTKDQIKTLVADGGKGTEDVISAGCTITVSEFVFAIEKSFENTKDYKASAVGNIALKLDVKPAASDASSSAKGNAELKGEFSAEVKNKNQVLVSDAKTETVSVTFNESGSLTES